MNKETLKTREMRLSDGLLGKSRLDSVSSISSPEISKSILAISALIMVVLSSCTEDEREELLSQISPPDQFVSNNFADVEESNDVYNGDSVEFVDYNEDINIVPSTYVFHNEGVFAWYVHPFPHDIKVSLYYEDKGELVVLDGVIEKSGVLNVVGIPDYIQEATLIYGEDSYTFEKNLSSKIDKSGF